MPFNFFLTRAVDKVHVITNFEKKLVKRAYLTPEEKFIVIPWGVELKTQNSKLKTQNYNLKLKSNTEELVILCVGRLSKHKGQMWLLEQYAEIVKNLSKPAQLIFVGADEGEKSAIKRLGDCAIKTNEQVTITGQVSEEELEEWYQRADIFALFPEYEAFGLVFLEAMAHGVPVLTHKVGAIEEVLNGAAMLIEPYNSVQVKVVLTKLIEDDKFRQELGQRDYNYVKDKFSWQKTAEKFLGGFSLRV